MSIFYNLNFIISDHVFDDKVSTEDIYNILSKSIVESVVEGINGTYTVHCVVHVCKVLTEREM